MTAPEREPGRPYLLVDAEGYLVPAAKASEHDIEWEPDDWQRICRHGDAIALFQDAMADLMAALPAFSLALVFGDRTTFRYGVYPQYKGNRKKEQKVPGWPSLVQRVEALARSCGWMVWRLPNVEADDTCGILASRRDIIASKDKDLLTIPGYIYRDGAVQLQTRLDADLAFYGQTLTGDKSDNYPGCPGIGEKGAEKVLARCHTELEMWQAVVKAYQKAGKSAAEAIVQARCARILRPGEYNMADGMPILWRPPVA